MLRFTDEHEWIRLEGNIATIGITTHAAEQLGDLVFIDLPKVGAKLKKGEAAAVVESVKAASDVYAPVSGEVTELNAAAVENPADVGTDPQGTGWLYKIRIDDPSAVDSFMDEAAYTAFVG
jgi:glycine cleavage system H protein